MGRWGSHPKFEVPSLKIDESPDWKSVRIEVDDPLYESCTSDASVFCDISGSFRIPLGKSFFVVPLHNGQDRH